MSSFSGEHYKFVSGDQALKGLSLAEKFGLAQKVAVLAESSPKLAKAIALGMDAMRQGTVGDIQQLAKGNTAAGAAETGAVVAGTAGVLSAIPVVGGLVKKAMGGTEIPLAAATETAATDAAGNPIEAAAEKAASKVAGKANLDEGVAATPRPEPVDTVQPDLQNNLRQTWQKVADEQHVTRPTATSIRDSGEQVGDAVLARSKDLYHQIDEATDGKFQPNADALKNVNLKLRSITGTDEATESSLLAQKAKLESQQEDLFQAAQKNGVEKDVVDRAKKDFKTAQSIYDINHEIQMTTSGVRPGMTGSDANPEIVNSKSLLNRLNKQYNSGRLQSAVGDENSDALIGHTSTAQVQANALKEAAEMNKQLGDFPPTERRAVLDLVEPNTQAGKLYGTNTDWTKTLKDFDNLTTDEQKARFQNPAKVRQALRSQAFRQNLKAYIGLGAGAVGGGGIAFEAGRKLLNEAEDLVGLGHND